MLAYVNALILQNHPQQTVVHISAAVGRFYVLRLLPTRHYATTVLVFTWCLCL